MTGSSSVAGDEPIASIAASLPWQYVAEVSSPDARLRASQSGPSACYRAVYVLSCRPVIPRHSLLNPLLRSCHRRPAGRQPPFRDRRRCRTTPQPLCAPLQLALRFFQHPAPGLPWPCLAARFPPLGGTVRGFPVPRHRYDQVRCSLYSGSRASALPQS